MLSCSPDSTTNSKTMNSNCHEIFDQLQQFSQFLSCQKTRENSRFAVSAFVVGFAEQDIWYQGFRKRKQKGNLTK